MKPLNTTYNEAAVIAGCCRNDRHSQELLYRRYFSTFIAMCTRYAHGDKERALEMLNDAFLRIFKKIESYDGRGSFEGWMRRVVFHAIADYFKRKPLTFDDLETQAADMSDRATIYDALFYDDLLALIDHLPPATAAVFKLFAVEGFAHQEIAEKMGISVGTSKWHVAEAREKLKEWLNRSEKAPKRADTGFNVLKFNTQ